MKTLLFNPHCALCWIVDGSSIRPLKLSLAEAITYCANNSITLEIL